MTDGIPDGMSLVSDDQFLEVRTRFAETAWGVGVYGAYAILLVITTYTLIKQGLRNSRARRILLAIVWFMFINSTIVGMVYISFFVMGINLLQRTRPNPPISNDFDRLYIVLGIFGGINYILGDGIVVWRAWVLYPSNKKVRGVLALCMIGSIVATIFNIVFSIKEVPHTHEEREGPGTLWFFLPLLATNLVTTLLVAYKVWSYRSTWSDFTNVKAVTSKSSVEKIMVVMVESGILFCLYWIISMLSALHVVGTLGHELLECILPQLEGIYLTLVILLVASQRESSGSASATMGFDEFSTIDFAIREQTNFSQAAYQSHGRSTIPRIGGSFVERVKETPQWSLTHSSRSSDIETGSSQVN